MRYLVAVSGGIDSMVLLHQLVTQGQHELIVAHFDHGIRDDSAADARFVAAAARAYGLECVTERAELGAGASEDIARQYRYGFLERVADARGAIIVTAHHADDVIETIALNIARGTGWRGLSVLDRSAVLRPLLLLTKQQIRDYALTHRLEWVEDSTNAETMYARNRMRRLVAAYLSADQFHGLLAAWQRQRHIRRAVDHELTKWIQPTPEYARYLFIMIDDMTAYELLRAVVVWAGGASPLRPQSERALIAIKTAQPGTVHELGGGTRLRFTKQSFIVEALR